MNVNINNNTCGGFSFNDECDSIKKIGEEHINITQTPTMQKNFSIYSSKSKNTSNTHFTTNFSDSYNNVRSVYSPFVIKKSSENFTNNSNINQMLNFNNYTKNNDNNGLNIFINSNSKNVNTNKNISSNNFFNKNHFSPEVQNPIPNHKIYTPSPIIVKNERLSDRFIPMNKGTNLLEKFELTRTYDIKSQSDVFNLNSDAKMIVKDRQEEVIDPMTSTYHNLLQNNFFGFDENFEDPILKSLGKTALEIEGYDKTNSNNRGNIKSKIFKFKTETKKKSGINLNVGNIFETIESSNISLNSQANNINSTRKIWNQCGTELAVGNSEGSVEIWDGINLLFLFK